MPKKEVTWQDAVVKALAEVDVLEFEAHVTTYPSKSDPRDFHYVMEFGKFEGGKFAFNGVTVCTCKAFRYNDGCPHVREQIDRRKKEEGRPI